MGFKEQLIQDVDAVFINASEFAESAALRTNAGSVVNGNAVVNVLGESDGDWSGGNAMAAVIYLSRSQFSAKPNTNETLTCAGVSWIVASVTEETPELWAVRAFSEHKPR